MKSAMATRYGAADVLEIIERPAPQPGAGEVQVAVHAATVGPADVAMRSGKPWIARLFAGLLRPKHGGGTEFAGIVSATGEGVTRFAVGDRVYGASVASSGAQSEYVAVPESGVLARQPAGLSHAESVSIADGPMTALVFLRDHARVEPGRRVLVNGASGAVGSAAVQLAKHYGCHVTGVASGRNAELVRALGADEFIDYTTADFTAGEARYDVIFDAIGKSCFGRARRVLTRRGIYLTTVPSFSILLAMLVTAGARGRRARFTAAGLAQTAANLETLTALVEAGALRPLIDRHYPLDSIVAAHRYVESERKRGSVVIDVRAEG